MDWSTHKVTYQINNKINIICNEMAEFFWHSFHRLLRLFLGIRLFHWPICVSGLISNAFALHCCWWPITMPKRIETYMILAAKHTNMWTGLIRVHGLLTPTTVTSHPKQIWFDYKYIYILFIYIALVMDGGCTSTLTLNDLTNSIRRINYDMVCSEDVRWYWLWAYSTMDECLRNHRPQVIWKSFFLRRRISRSLLFSTLYFSPLVSFIGYTCYYQFCRRRNVNEALFVVSSKFQLDRMRVVAFVSTVPVEIILLSISITKIWSVNVISLQVFSPIVVVVVN